ncbi:MAG: SUMF1/EgtB/PvdO family nonheme iron enzyme [Caldilineaceae bacterium]
MDIRLDQLLELAPQLVVTGGPGCGKTTVLQHIAWTLAVALTENSALATEKLGLVVGADESGDKAARLLPLPLYVTLSRYVNYRRELRQRGRPDEPHKTTLLNFISYYMIERGTAPRLPADFFVRLIEQGEALLLLLDGLDEVPNDEERRHVCMAIQDLVAGKGNLRVVVTCRTAAYKGETMLDDDFQPVQVKPLAEEQVLALVAQAFACIEPQDETRRQEKVAELTSGIRHFEEERAQRMGDRYQRLIDSPLMVRLLLLVFLTGRGFPKQRADLYERATQALLQPNYTLDDAVARQIGELVGGNPVQHRSLVEYLAFQMHQAGETQGREQSHDDLGRLLNQEAALAPLADAFLALTRVRGGLLEERLGAYRFFHLAFQEYLAACYLAKTRLGEGGVDGVAAFLEAEDLLLDSWWREPALLITGHFVSSNDLTNARRFVRRLAGVTPPNQRANQGAPLSPDLQLAAAEIAQLSCLEWLEKDVALRAELSQRAAALLTNPRFMNKAKPSLRAAAGVALGQLGDPRPGVGVRNGLPDLAWSKTIEPGPFIMGDDQSNYDDEKPQFTCNLITQPYRISRYPITVAQYSKFVEAGGYTQRRYWTEAGWQWRAETDITGPESYGAVFQNPNHPQVGVSWYEAVAFCNWLTDMIEYEVRLPTEAEWERAARHTDGRNYPWGAKFDAKRCNMAETGIGSTSAVGLFPNGDAQCGAADMSGNVLEWCSTPWLGSYEDYETEIREDLEGDARRVLRGGSFASDDSDARCAGRNVDFPRPVRRYRFSGSPPRLCCSGL